MLWTADPAERDAKLAYKALKKKDDRHVWVIIELACASSSDHLMAVRKAYHSLFSSSIEEDIAFKFSETNLLRQVIRSSILGLGTDEASLTRSIVSRAEIDMKKIKEEYKKRYRTTLNDDVIGDTSGYYKSFLLALVGSADS
ncbi:hypothetical protein BHM03_00013525 [Ensete ventricosum]|nr:hypothetical protein BHM03_00013525 [Ensete ventricosum]